MGTESKLHAPAALPPAPNEQECGLARVRLDVLERQTLLLQRIVRVLVCPSHTLATILPTVSQPASYQNCVQGFLKRKIAFIPKQKLGILGSLHPTSSPHSLSKSSWRVTYLLLPFLYHYLLWRILHWVYKEKYQWVTKHSLCWKGFLTTHMTHTQRYRTFTTYFWILWCKPHKAICNSKLQMFLRPALES
jgi:hypothetical protein